DSMNSSTGDLAYGVDKANGWGADLFVSIHFNKAYDSYNGAIGSEVCVYSTHEIAQRVVNGLVSLGFKNRGQKIRKGLYELKHTNMKSMIVETCFVEATEDVALYRKLGADEIGKAIAEAIANKKIEATNNEETFFRVIAGSYKERDNAEKRKKELEEKGFTGVFLEAFRK
ncbi:N-acetylmuramoyl-L-alanine amidase, partial [uncultured Clostridium sp.]